MAFRFLDFELDTERSEFRKDGEACAVEPQVFDLLRHLIENRHRLVSRDELFEKIWLGRIVSDATLSSRIKAARQIVGDSGKAQTVIQTLPRRGFRFVAEVTEVPESNEPVGSPKTEEAVHSEQTKKSERSSIAVLPFTNMSDNPEQTHFADGITEDLITALSRYKSNYVMSRHSVSSFRDQSSDVRNVAKELGARFILEGSVRRTGKRTRVTARLVEGIEGGQLWAQRFDSSSGNTFDLQDEIVSGIVGAIAPIIREAEIRRRRNLSTSDLSAWDHWILANKMSEGMTQEIFDDIVFHYQEALRIDPGFSNASAGYALLLLYATISGLDLELGQSLTQAHELALNAVAADRNNYFAHTALGAVKSRQGDHQGALEELQIALELNPSASPAHLHYATILYWAGKIDEALRVLAIHLEQNPRNQLRSDMESLTGALMAIVGDYEGCIKMQKRALRGPGNKTWPYLSLGSAMQMLGKTDDAKDAIAAALEISHLLTCTKLQELFATCNDPRKTHFIEALRSAGLPED